MVSRLLEVFTVHTLNCVLVHNVLTCIFNDRLLSWIVLENLVTVNVITVVLMNNVLHC
jgi:hypothetical protein